MSSDDVHNFLMEAHRISQEAQFIVDSLPNAEQPAVERVLHQLSAKLLPHWKPMSTALSIPLRIS
ncbi:hypothetical protein B0H10DRAFT_2061067 [Mycena sp. CBHHK59/15]|nr:hypothetical protein B0H10DRAFT_2079776 [Mycena sp. CBHHK59/15]KAJ6610293.1 hypothetical protein B0H10DRAFT_2061067 [Mycena sp. CBHHK59/15]